MAAPQTGPASSEEEVIKHLLTIREHHRVHEGAQEAYDHVQQLVQSAHPELLASLGTQLSDLLWPPSASKKQRTEATLACLSLLPSSALDTSPNQLLLRLAAFIDPQYPWTTPEAGRISSSILDRILPYDDAQRSREKFIVESILQGYLRPLFSRTTSKVTSSGRPSAYQEDAAARMETRLNVEEPAWKKEGPHALAIFQWAVTASDETLIKENWPLFTPVLLTIAESEDSSTRLAGLHILTHFIQKCPAKILHTTGINTVFEDAIFPSLLHLPSLTPEPESVRITTAAYAALVELVKKYDDPQSVPRRQLLDKILRRGVFTAYDHASQYFGVVDVLMGTTATLVELMGIYAVKHLQVRIVRHLLHYLGLCADSTRCT
jgi:hypothetical protein